LAGFKNRAEYVKNDFRFKNPRRVMKIWAEKEFLNLQRFNGKNNDKIILFFQTSPCQNKMSNANQIEETGKRKINIQKIYLFTTRNVDFINVNDWGQFTGTKIT
jgi:hypothetical protein